MSWLTWRQFRAQAAMTAAALAALAVILALTGPGLADEYATGIAACTAEGGDCSGFLQRFYVDNRGGFLVVTALALVLPALIGLFWGTPLVTRELEAGTHRLVWTQSVTRTRWLAVKLGLVGLAAVTTAGLGSLAVSWWASPIDKTAVDDFPRMAPLLFDARGIVPIAYAAFAFVLAVTVGMLVRRTVPAMAVALSVFVAVQIAMPLLVRPHLAAPALSTVEITQASLSEIRVPRDGGSIRAWLKPPDTGVLAGAWILSSKAVDASGDAVASIPLSRTGGCAPSRNRPGKGSGAGAQLSTCLAEMKRLGYRQRVTYQPYSRFWTFQWYETGIYAALTLGLAGFCFWRLRRDLS